MGVFTAFVLNRYKAEYSRTFVKSFFFVGNLFFKKNEVGFGISAPDIRGVELVRFGIGVSGGSPVQGHVHTGSDAPGCVRGATTHRGLRLYICKCVTSIIDYLPRRGLTLPHR